MPSVLGTGGSMRHDRRQGEAVEPGQDGFGWPCAGDRGERRGGAGPVTQASRRAASANAVETVPPGSAVGMPSAARRAARARSSIGTATGSIAPYCGSRRATVMYSRRATTSAASAGCPATLSGRLVL
jgi:hypothetical protein